MYQGLLLRRRLNEAAHRDSFECLHAARLGACARSPGGGWCGDPFGGRQRMCVCFSLMFADAATPFSRLRMTIRFFHGGVISMRNTIISLAACTLLGAAAYGHEADSSAPVPDNATPDGAVTLKGGSVAAGIGYTWGHGELKYRDGLHQV